MLIYENNFILAVLKFEMNVLIIKIIPVGH